MIKTEDVKEGLVLLIDGRLCMVMLDYNTDIYYKCWAHVIEGGVPKDAISELTPDDLEIAEFGSHAPSPGFTTIMNGHYARLVNPPICPEVADALLAERRKRFPCST